ncbi:MAG: hypothetical protein JSR47_23225 [Proteobacteria bacterium]|nr:hypothetical protein [Pseudomonadota bacterium]
MKKPLAAAVLTLSLAAACTPKPPAEKKPAPDYQMPLTRFSPPNLAKICYNPTDANTVYVRMVQGEMAVGYLTCQNPDGTRKFNSQYGDVVSKFSAELSANGQELKTLFGKRRLNIDAVVTEFANREAQRRNDDPQFCSRMERAFAWALSPGVTSLSQVPPPHDLGPEMNIFPCAK